MQGWLTINDTDTLRGYWPGMDEADEETLALLLASARIQCEEYAPQLPEDADAPANYRHAQALQARALFRAGESRSGDTMGGAEGMTVTVFPMDWTVKRLLRPQKGRPRVG